MLFLTKKIMPEIQVNCRASTEEASPHGPPAVQNVVSLRHWGELP